MSQHDPTQPGEARPITAEGVGVACQVLGIDPITLWAVLDVETGGCGFLKDKRIVILYERHIFHRLTNGCWSDGYPALSASRPGGYGLGGTNQYERLANAMALDRSAALRSTSWGIAQIMGFNHLIIGYSSLDDMIMEFADSENAQIHAMSMFIRFNRIDDALRELDWQTFARRYNGSGYARNKYDVRLATAYARRRRIGIPDLQVRADQMRLWWGGYYNGIIDGIRGKRTIAAEVAESGLA